MKRLLRLQGPAAAAALALLIPIASGQERPASVPPVAEPDPGASVPPVAGPAAAPAAAPVPAEAGFPIRIGRSSGPTIYAPLGQLSAAERAKIAAVRLDEALADPACTPESLTLGDAESRPGVFVCGRELLRAGPHDALVAGQSTEEVARRWLDEIRPRFAREKAALYSSTLLRSGVLGIVIPVLWIAALIAARFVFLRLRLVLLHPRWHRRAIAWGGVTLLSASGVRRLLSSLLAVLRWLAYLVLTWGFAVAMLRLIPTTSSYGVRLTERVWRAASEAGTTLFGLLPRLALLVLLGLLLRASLRAVSRSFGGGNEPDAVSGREPIVRGGRTTAITIQLALIGLFVLLAGLLLPGPPGIALLALSALLALVFLVGVRDLAADFLAGLALHYGRVVRRGTWLRAGSLEGTVADDGPLALTLRTGNGALVRVPYRTLARVPLEFGSHPHAARPPDRTDGADDPA
ncbi:MAG: mechanosensitive ion channel family protein [Acidobacteria bacterium]|nr:mechanosensitive ion channel family protein [Acidobacteriota bacterium]